LLLVLEVWLLLVLQLWLLRVQVVWFDKFVLLRTWSLLDNLVHGCLKSRLFDEWLRD
jgi:hypothetical protein